MGRINLVLANYLRIAREDLDGVYALVAAKNRNAAYLCEQATEKILRAVLTAEGVHIKREISHELPKLVDLVPDENPLKPKFRELEELKTYATTYRYPKPEGEIRTGPSIEEIKGFTEKIEAVLREAAEAFGVDLAERSSPARLSTPIR